MEVTSSTEGAPLCRVKHSCWCGSSVLGTPRRAKNPSLNNLVTSKDNTQAYTGTRFELRKNSRFPTSKHLGVNPGPRPVTRMESGRLLLYKKKLPLEGFFCFIPMLLFSLLNTSADAQSSGRGYSLP